MSSCAPEPPALQQRLFNGEQRATQRADQVLARTI
jgi:hypothetical protein